MHEKTKDSHEFSGLTRYSVSLIGIAVENFMTQMSVPCELLNVVISAHEEYMYVHTVCTVCRLDDG